jgi:5-methylphenazine-1-carboxylate 1-monooxygenase
VRKQFYPNDNVAFSGINTWRSVTRHKPILGGRTYMRIGSILTGKVVIYPIIDNVDDDGNQLINWMAEIKRDTAEHKPGNLADFFPLYETWRFDWLDVTKLIRDAEQILEYPMVDKDPIDRWTFAASTNGAAQAAIDARTLADLLKTDSVPRAALEAYEAARVAPAAKVVRTNREQPPDFINIKVRGTGRRQTIRQSG